MTSLFRSCLVDFLAPTQCFTPTPDEIWQNRTREIGLNALPTDLVPAQKHVDRGSSGKILKGARGMLFGVSGLRHTRQCFAAVDDRGPV